MATPGHSKDADTAVQRKRSNDSNEPDLPSLRHRSRHPDDVEPDLESLSSAYLAESTEDDTDIAEQISELDELTQPSLVCSFSAKLNGDSKTPLLYDISLTSSESYLIVTDCYNHCVKAFDLRRPNFPCQSVFPLKDMYPLCITRIGHPERVAFTVHDRKEIYILRVEESSEDVAVLVFDSIIPVGCKYRGITNLPSMSSASSEVPDSGEPSESHNTYCLAVTAPKEIHVLSPQGNVLQVIAPALSGLPLLNDAIYITTTPAGDVVVSDVGSRRVVCVGLSGCLRWFHPLVDASDDDQEESTDKNAQSKSTANSFKGVQWPLGIATDAAGRVFVCDLEQHSVIVLSSMGVASRPLLNEAESLEYPRGLQVTNGQLFLTQDFSVKIFSF